MTVSFSQTLISLLAGIVLIILLTTRLRVHAFFALFLACFVTGIGLALPVDTVIGAVKEGFGNIMKSLGLIIVLGTTLGVLLEHSGSTRVMAAFILKKTGPERAGLAMSITGFIVGLPVFCDSGYIVLGGLVGPMAKRTGIPLATLSVCLATGLYSVHCLIPPHPGAAAAAGTIGVDFGTLILWGTLVAVPAMLVGYGWAVLAGKNIPPKETTIEEVPEKTAGGGPSVFGAFFPVLLPLVLIACRSFFLIDAKTFSGGMGFLLALGDPVLALSCGVLAALLFNRGWTKRKLSQLLQESAEKAGGILVIIGAGGAFGAVLATAIIGQHFSGAGTMGGLGLLFPFLLTFLLKTAQGSSTVAIITASSIVQPLLPALGLDSHAGKLLCILSMGAGSMLISHANDAYFWVIAKFSGLEMKTMLKVYTVATVLMGLTSLLAVYILSIFMR